MTYLTGHASPHFTWAELGVTSATRTVHRDAMGVLASTILEPIRAHVGGPVRVNRPDLGLLGRGWRASQGIGSATSQHLVGQAVDLDIDGDLVALFRWLAFDSRLPFGQCIIEKRRTAHWSWIHVSLGVPYREIGKCGQVLCSPDGTTYQRVTRATAL